MSWLSASATRASINLSFARRDNLADITAKSGSQAIAGSLLGTGLGILASPWIGSTFNVLFPTFIGLATFQLYAVYRAVSVVQPNIFNQQRAEIVIRQYLDSFDKSRHIIASPSDVSKREQFVWPKRSTININPKLETFVQDFEEIERLRSIFHDENYVMAKRSGIDIVYMVNASTTDVIRGVFQACKLEQLVEQEYGQETIESLIVVSLQFTRERFPVFLNGLKNAGWTLEHDFIEERPNRVQFLQAVDKDT